MKIIKKIIIFFSLFLLFLNLSACNIGYNKKNLLTLGISVNIPKNMKFGYSSSTIFNYNNTSIPSITTQCLDKKNMIKFKSFPFTIEDYKNHFKSAFSSKNVIKIVYDYKKVDIKNENIDKIYKSKAKLNINGEKKYSYIYLISFKNSSGTLIIETITNRDKDFKSIIKSLKPIKSNIENIQYKENSKEENTQDINIIEDIDIPIPKSYKIKKSKTTSQYFINGFGENSAIYIVASKEKPISTTSLKWNNINGYEVLKEYSDNTFLIHDYNTELLYFLNTEIKEVKSKTGHLYYLRIEKISKAMKEKNT